MKTFIAAVMAFFMAVSGLLCDGDMKTELKAKGSIEGFSQTVPADKDFCDFTVDDDGEFTVLQFSDTHFTTGISFSDIYLLEKMEAQTKKYSPDLVVVTGDMIDDGNDGLFNKAYVLRTVAEMFEELNQYWSYVPGNNDGVNYGTTSDVTAYLSQYEHCLVRDEKDISGGAQHSIDIYDGERLTHSIVFLDTMDYDDEDDFYIYGYVLEDQVQWVKEEIASKKEANEEVTVSVFMHENTPDFVRAGKNGESYGKGYSNIALMGEKYDIPKNQPLDDVLTESGCVGLVSIGHVHPAVAMCNYYNGTYYHIAQQTVVSSTFITINTDADNTKDMYEFELVVG